MGFVRILSKSWEEVMKSIVRKWNKLNFIVKILIGLVIGCILGFLFPQATFIGWLGDLFVGSLKAIAPILVFFLVASSLCQAKNTHGGIIKTIVILYLVSTLIAAIVAVVASTIFPVEMVLTDVTAETAAAPSNIIEVLENMILQLVQNPVQAIADANYLGILFWAVIFGILMKKSPDSLKNMLTDISDVISKVVSMIVSLAPFGILGIAYTNIISGGLEAFGTYGKLLILLVGCMAFQYLVCNPIIVWWCIRQNPYPLVWKCFKKSAITAFFTRSSAANIPVNMEAAAEMGLDPDTYSVTIPLGATVNMDGAAITITVMTLATVHTLGIPMDIPTAILLSVLASIAAAGASGVAGGSLLLIPLACSLFGISDAIAMQVVAVGFLLGVVQDSVETALNSSSDLLLTASAEFREWRKKGKKIVF